LTAAIRLLAGRAVGAAVSAFIDQGNAGDVEKFSADAAAFAG